MWKARWPWIPATFLGSLFVLYWLIGLWAPLPDTQENTPDPPSEADSSAWLRGLVRMEGVRFVEFRGNDLGWEIATPIATVRSLRTRIGRVAFYRVLYVSRPTATLYARADALIVHANRGYFDPRRRQWIFVDGVVIANGRPRPFERLYWYPAQRRLEWESRSRALRNPLLRFWERRL